MGKKLYNGNYLDFKNLPYEDRQFILIQKDEEFEKVLKKLKQDSKLIDLDKIDWKKLISFSPAAFFFPVATAGIGAVYLLYKLIKNNIGINVIVITNSVASNLKLPFGHPKNNTLYVGHPYVNNVYYTFATFHKDLVNSQIMEASDILRALGAIDSELLIEVGKQIEKGGNVELGFFDDNENAKIKRTSDEKGNRAKSIDYNPISFLGLDVNKVDDFHYKVVLNTQFKKSDKEPCLPDNLIWYHQNEIWQHQVKQRLEQGSINLRLIVEIENDFCVNAELYGKLDKLGFNLGGKYKEFKNSKLIMFAKFE